MGKYFLKDGINLLRMQIRTSVTLVTPHIIQKQLPLVLCCRSVRTFNNKCIRMSLLIFLVSWERRKNKKTEEWKVTSLYNDSWCIRGSLWVNAPIQDVLVILLKLLLKSICDFCFWLALACLCEEKQKPSHPLRRFWKSWEVCKLARFRILLLYNLNKWYLNGDPNSVAYRKINESRELLKTFSFKQTYAGV